MSSDAPARPPSLKGLDALPESSPGNLDDLLSPTLNDPGTARPTLPPLDARDSMTPTELADAQVRFSNVPLSTAVSTATLDDASSRKSISSWTSRASRDGRRNTVAFESSGSSTLVSPTSSKRPMSGDSAQSSGSLPFMLQRLDLQKAKNEDERKSRRQSQMILQNEFAKVHEQQIEIEKPAGPAIDWGAFLLVGLCLVFADDGCT